MPYPYRANQFVEHVALLQIDRSAPSHHTSQQSASTLQTICAAPLNRKRDADMTGLIDRVCLFFGSK